MKPIRICLFAVMFLVFSAVYAKADERQILGPFIMDEPFSRINDKDSGWEPLTGYHMTRTGTAKESTGNTKHKAGKVAKTTTHAQGSLSRCVNFFNKWLSLSVGEEERGIYFSMNF
jgi:hypothetical protein